MSYVGTPFDHDLFVTYSHGDDGRGKGILRPWSQAFAEALETELRLDRRLRKSLSVFLDAKYRDGEGIDPMSGLTPQLESQVRSSAMLVVLMSPDYLASEKWCARERSWWVEEQTRLALPTEERIAVVRILPTSQPWPRELCDPEGEPLIGFLFHEESTGRAVPLGWIDLPESFGREFRVALLGLAGRLAEKLDRFRARLEAVRVAEQEAAKLQQVGGQSIYLHGRKNQQASWERAAIALADSGYAVLPGEPDLPVEDPQEALDQCEQRVNTLAACDALLVLGTEDGRSLDEDMIRVGRQDRESARARARRLLPGGVLDTVGEPIATLVRRATARNLQLDWIDGTESNEASAKQPLWIDRLQSWLAERGSATGHGR